ncbi:hypothetical protein WR25_25738 isoform B [Diploscapter pachys]|uniref:ShKT domain-containing protein n=1 Tax=Diploscapter pachys TaxID=2018661 RepID=A0A2A2JDX4_9BILA|nr:hypothetical protein WR25_25738 isoform B [Diploscapter pachys]
MELIHYCLALCFILLSVIEPIHSESSCDNIKDPQGRIFCYKLQNWDTEARKRKKKAKVVHPPGVRAGSRDTSVSADAAVIPVGIGECYNLECACELLEESHNPRMENGQCMTNKGPLGQAVRKELRTLTASERKTLFDALLLLHESGEFHQHVRAHGHADKSAGAHGGPAFLPWHREYLKRVELALRQFDTSIGIPYIDWTLDDALENPRDSILFSEYLMGDTSGKRDNENGSWVINGPFKDFATAHGNPRLTRWVGVPFEDPITKEMIKPRPMTQEHVDYQLNAENVDQIITFPIFKNEKGCKYSDQIKNAGEMDPENAHGRGHMFVGGDMNEFSTASNDPIFYMHHAFVDFLWEEWRKNKQDSSQWETEWITDSEACSAPQHFREANMYPFIPMVNRDGLSVNYTKNMYKYEPRPTCNPDLGIDCKSEFLFCDLTKGKKGPRCASKIKKGKSCSGYEHKEDVCYLGECVDGKCVENDPNRPKTTPSPKPKTIKKMTKQETCWNENKCCAFWAARGDCKYNKAYMDQHCKASCGICKPGYKLVDDCTDRSPHCKNWKAQGYCEQYKDSMDENCRRSCNRCENTRAQECSAEGFSATTKAPFRCHDTLRNKCYNEHPCCQYWSQLGECQRNIVWMSCHCKVSCGVCYPDDYYYNSEIDYHAACPSLARKGECPRRLWMTGNINK